MEFDLRFSPIISKDGGKYKTSIIVGAGFLKLKLSMHPPLFRYGISCIANDTLDPFWAEKSGTSRVP